MGLCETAGNFWATQYTSAWDRLSLAGDSFGGGALRMLRYQDGMQQKQ